MVVPRMMRLRSAGHPNISDILLKTSITCMEKKTSQVLQFRYFRELFN
jgi:hypothetical protein